MTTSPARTNADALRSLKRYVAQMLGDAWEIRMHEEEGTFGRPGAIVLPTDQATVSDGTSKWIAQVIQPFAIYAYPEVGEDTDASRLRALEVEELLFQGFRVGVEEGRPGRVPIFDYDGLSLDDAASNRGYADFMRVSGLTIGSRQDPNDRTLWTVVCELRLTWLRTAAKQRVGADVTTVVVEPAP